MTIRRSAARYAAALFEVGRREGDPEAAGRDLAAFVALAGGHDLLRRVFANPSIPVQRKVALVDALADRTGLGGVVRKLVVLLARRDRLVLLPVLLEEYRGRLLDARNVVRAEVTSATPLPAGAAEAIGRAIGQRTGREIEMTARVDPALIGGIVTKVGSLVYDGSVKRQLEKMKDALTGAT